MGRKDDWQRTVPLCFSRPGRLGCHSKYDDEKQSFPARHGLDMDAEAVKNCHRWRAYAATLEGVPW